MHAAPLDDLKVWFLENLAQGCTPAQLQASIAQAGWAEGTFEQVIALVEDEVRSSLRADAVPRASGPAEQKARAPERRRWSIPVLDVASWGNRFTLLGQEMSIRLHHDRPQVLVVDGFLSAQECDDLIEASREKLKRSETVDPASGGSVVHHARTSEGGFFQRGETALVRRIEDRLAALANWPLENGEGLQILRYGVGAEYRPHLDYFNTSHPGTEAILKRGGQRVATLILYLNDVQKGGGTGFPNLKLEVMPRRGSLLFFSYDSEDPAEPTLHGGSPVVEGEKWIATKWLREGVFV